MATDHMVVAGGGGGLHKLWHATGHFTSNYSTDLLTDISPTAYTHMDSREDTSVVLACGDQLR